MKTFERIRRISALLAPFDRKGEERRRTDAVAVRAFGPRPGWRCAICGQRKHGSLFVAAAHIMPLAEGGTTNEANVITLCDAKAILPTVIGDLLSTLPRDESISLAEALRRRRVSARELAPCHKLFDAGFIRTSSIRSLRESWRDKKRWPDATQLRDDALSAPLAKLNSDYNPARDRHTALRRLQHEVHQPGSIEWFKAQCRVISAARRLASSRAFGVAVRVRDALEVFISGRTKTWSDAGVESWFHYESALVWMQDWDNPSLLRAIEMLRESYELVQGAEAPKSWAMSRLEYLHACMLNDANLDRSYLQQFCEQQNECVEVLPRWRINALIHRAQCALKCRVLDEAACLLEELVTERDKLTVADGWTQFQRMHILCLRAVLLAHVGDVKSSVSTAARVFRSFRVARGKRPEGFLDVAQAARYALAQSGEHKRANELGALIADMKDARSGGWAAP